MAKKATTTIPQGIATYEQANDALKEIGLIESRIAIRNSKHQSDKQDIDNAYSDEIREDASKLELLRAELKEFCIAKKDEIGTSLPLPSGVVGFRALKDSFELKEGFTEKDIVNSLKATDKATFKAIVEDKYVVSKNLINAFFKAKGDKAKAILSRIGYELKTDQKAFWYKTSPEAK